jgi:tetratricopeptide (TPR) repeat protein
MSADQARQPAWFAEGIAEMLSTFERHGDRVDWGKPISSHLELLRKSGTLPLAEFLAEPSAIFDRDDRTERFYAQSWLFTHFLMLSKEPSRRQAPFAFLRAFRSESGEATVNAVFGASLKELDRDFKQYVGQSTYAYMKLPVKAAPAPPSPQPAPPALVEASLGFLALSSKHDDLARSHAEKAISLDATVPDAHAVLAYLDLQNNDFDKAASHAEQALQHDSKDSELFMLMGDSYVHGQNFRKPDAAQARVRMYENAVNLNPRRLAIYERLTEALLAIENPREEDARFLAAGLRAFPGEDWLRVGSAVVDYRLGRREAAMTTIESALRTDGTLDGAQRTYATGLRGRWLLEAMRTEMDTAVNEGDFRAARAVVAHYRERIGNNADFSSYLDEIDNGLAVRDLVNQHEAALRANRKAEAKAVADQLLARPDLPGNLRRSLQEQNRKR